MAVKHWDGDTTDEQEPQGQVRVADMSHFYFSVRKKKP